MVHRSSQKLKINRNGKLMSLDETIMLGKITKREQIEIIENNNVIGDLNILIKEIIIDQNYCRFDNEFYKQTIKAHTLIAMGSLLSPV